VDRRDFIKAAGVASAWPAVAPRQRATAASDRDVWVGVMRRLADPLGLSAWDEFWSAPP
jgi:hypothetical protein